MEAFKELLTLAGSVDRFLVNPPLTSTRSVTGGDMLHDLAVPLASERSYVTDSIHDWSWLHFT